MPELILSQPSADMGMMRAFAASGWRNVMIDLEHGPIGEAETIAAAAALGQAGATLYLKMPDQDPRRCMRYFQFGVRHFILPSIDSAEKVRAVHDRLRDVFWIDPAEIRLFPLIESRAGLDAVAEICAVAGVAGVHLGPVDLGRDLGFSFRTLAEFAALGERMMPTLLAGLDAIRAGGKPNGCMVMRSWLPFFPIDRLDQVTFQLSELMSPATLDLG